MRDNPVSWIAGLVTAIPLIAFAWIARAFVGEGSGDIGSDSILLTFVILIIATPVALLLGGLLMFIGQLSDRNALRDIGVGVLLGAALGFIGGAISCFASAARY